MSPRRGKAARLRGRGSDFSDLQALVADLGKLTPAMRSELRRGMLAAGKHAHQDARRRASWSSRIPGAVQIGASTGKATIGVYLRVNAARAPHARAYEGLTDRRAFFRHPVFGDPDTWVSQATRPFLAPAVQAARPAVIAAAKDAVKGAARAANFR